MQPTRDKDFTLEGVLTPVVEIACGEQGVTLGSAVTGLLGRYDVPPGR